MDRISDPTAVPDLFGPGKPGFTDGNPIGGIDPTFLNAAWFNGLQEEALSVIESVGIVPAAGDNTQQRQAIRRMAGANKITISTNIALTPDNAGVVVVNATANNITITLPAANAAAGAPFSFDLVRWDTTARTVTVQRTGADNIREPVATSFGLQVGMRVRLTSNGENFWFFGALVRPGLLIDVRTFSGNGTYTPTPGTRFVVVEAVGGGGGGAGARIAGSGNAAAGIAGNAGSYGKGQYTTGFSGAAITIGAAGFGGVGAAGTSGGTTSFGALMSCPGGPGGLAGAAQSGSASGGNGNISGLPVGANIVAATGGVGSLSFGFTTGQVASGGSGGASHFGAGGVGTAANLNGSTAQSPGSGGAGTIGISNTGVTTGGDGAAGIIIVWEYA